MFLTRRIGTWQRLEEARCCVEPTTREAVAMIRQRLSANSWLLVVLLGLFLIETATTAQSGRDQPHAPAAGTGVIRGRVVRADTGEPLRRVQVRVDEWSTADHSGPAATMTDAQGRYELTQLPPGRYQLKATSGE